nr:hypothetical protein CFP56_76142 [Quercus suber]
MTDAGDRRTVHGAPNRGNPLPPPLGIIDVIHAAPRGVSTAKAKGVLTVTSVEGSGQAMSDRHGRLEEGTNRPEGSGQPQMFVVGEPFIATTGPARG